LFLNLEQFNHPEQWIDSMIGGLSQIQDEAWLKAAKKFKDFLPRLESKYLKIAAPDWQGKGQHLMQDLLQLDQPIWFLLDEFPIMIDQIAKSHGLPLAEAALHWVRSLRQQPDSKVRFLFTGAIGLDSILRQYNINHVANDLRREELKPLSFEEALAFTLKLASDNQIELSEDLARDYLQRLGAGLWPYLIQLFVAELQDQDAPPISQTDIERIFHTIACSKRNQYAANMWDRLRDIFTAAEQTIARTVLKFIAAQPTGIALDQLHGKLPQFETNEFEYVIDVLLHDGYLTETTNGDISFFSNLLRDYWLFKARI
jgi:hypothetical protein